MDKTIIKLEIALKALRKISSGAVTAYNNDKFSIAEAALYEIHKIETEENESANVLINLASVVDSINFNNFTESQLATIIEGAIIAINKKKAERQGETVDVGFWDNKGVYVEDRQKFTPKK